MPKFSFFANQFCKEYDKFIKNVVKPYDGKRYRNKPSRTSDAEVITILIALHSSRMRKLKHFYMGYICVHCRHLFQKLLSYNRFAELEREVGVELFIVQITSVRSVFRGQLCVFHRDARIMQPTYSQLQGFQRPNKKKKTFNRLKLHIIINDKVEILKSLRKTSRQHAVTSIIIEYSTMEYLVVYCVVCEKMFMYVLLQMKKILLL